jgi:hypothetical protein
MKCVQRQELMPVKLKISDVENVCWENAQHQILNNWFGFSIKLDVVLF